MGNIEAYLREHTKRLTTFHFYQAYTDKPSYSKQYTDGIITAALSFSLFQSSNKFVRLVLHYIYFTYILLTKTKRGVIVIIENPFFCILHSLFSFIKNAQFIFIIADYYPNKTGTMRFYHYLVNYYNRRMPHVIYLSPPLVEIYERARIQHRKPHQTTHQISVGIQKRFDKNLHEKEISTPIKIGFIGVIREQQGLDLLFEYLSDTDHTATIDIIGDGYKVPFYKTLAQELGIADRVIFHGFVKDPGDIMRSWTVGAALYEHKANNLSIFGEPTKIKEYLSYGLPVITTHATYLHTEIRKYAAGKVIHEHTSNLKEAIDEITSHYPHYLQGVEHMVDAYEYKQWYDKRLHTLLT